MKTKALTTVFVLFILFVSKAELPPVSNTIYEDFNITKTLEKQIDFPAEIQQGVSGTVIAKFHLNENGDVVINEIISSHPVFETYIKTVLKQFRPEIIDEETIGKELLYKFSFDNENKFSS